MSQLGLTHKCRMVSSLSYFGCSDDRGYQDEVGCQGPDDNDGIPVLNRNGRDPESKTYVIRCYFEGS